MLLDEIFIWARHLFLDIVKTTFIKLCILEQWWIHKPKCPVFHWEHLNHLSSERNLNILDSFEYKLAEFFIKEIKVDGLLECTAWLVKMMLSVLKKRSPTVVRIVERRGGICCCKDMLFCRNLQTFSWKSAYKKRNLTQKVLISIKISLWIIGYLENCRIFALELRRSLDIAKYRNEQKSARFHIVIYIM